MRCQSILDAKEVKDVEAVPWSTDHPENLPPTSQGPSDHSCAKASAHDETKAVLRHRPPIGLRPSASALIHLIYVFMK